MPWIASLAPVEADRHRDRLAGVRYDDVEGARAEASAASSRAGRSRRATGVRRGSHVFARAQRAQLEDAPEGVDPFPLETRRSSPLYKRERAGPRRPEPVGGGRWRAVGRTARPAETVGRFAPRWGETWRCRVYTSRLIGTRSGPGDARRREHLHEGQRHDAGGRPRESLVVKGSGWDLRFHRAGRPARVDLAHLRRLRALAELSDEEMVNQLRTHLYDAGAPNPSVETLLHAFLPHASSTTPTPKSRSCSPISRAPSRGDGARLLRAAAGPSFPMSCPASRSPSWQRGIRARPEVEAWCC